MSGVATQCDFTFGSTRFRLVDLRPTISPLSVSIRVEEAVESVLGLVFGRGETGSLGNRYFVVTSGVDTHNTSSLPHSVVLYDIFFNKTSSSLRFLL